MTSWQKPGQYLCCQNLNVDCDIEDDIMDRYIKMEMVMPHSSWSQFHYTCSCQTTKTILKSIRLKNHESQELKQGLPQNMIYKIFLQRYQVYQGRLLASFQDDAKYEHVGQDTRSQGDFGASVTAVVVEEVVMAGDVLVALFVGKEITVVSSPQQKSPHTSILVNDRWDGAISPHVPRSLYCGDRIGKDRQDDGNGIGDGVALIMAAL
ncbi:hypothetical protein Tco_0327721 [Tanacetum coccineum]